MNLIRDIFTYPFRGGGKAILILGTGLFVAGDLMAFAPGIGIIANFILFAYFCSVYFQIIESTATGGAEAPEFPDSADLIGDLFVPMLRVVAVIVACYAPALIYLLLAAEPGTGVFLAWLGLGVVYFPMAMLAVGVLGYLGAMSPHIVFPAIFRSGGIYWLAVFLLAMLYLGQLFVLNILGGLLIVESLVASLLAMYLLMTNGRTLGIIYRERREAMGWI
jgi:hypothetical protein